MDSKPVGSAVVDDGCDPLEQRLLVDLAEGQAVGFVVHQGQVGPPTGGLV